MTSGFLASRSFPTASRWPSAGKEANVRIWDVETGKERQTLKDPTVKSGFESVAISPDGKTVAVGSWDSADLCVGRGKGRHTSRAART